MALRFSAIWFYSSLADRKSEIGQKLKGSSVVPVDVKETLLQVPASELAPLGSMQYAVCSVW